MMTESWDVETKQGNDYKIEVPPDGAIPARVCALIDVGSHDAHSFKGGGVYQRRVLLMGYELDEKDSEGNPFYLTELYNLTLDMKSNLYSIVKALHGELKVGDRFSPAMLANKPCLLQISHETKTKNGKERTYANLDSVGKPPRGTQTPQGGCVVWRVADLDRIPLPDVSYLPPKWHEGTGKMLTIPEWVHQCYEVQEAGKGPSVAADARQASGRAEPARDVTPRPRVQPVATSPHQVEPVGAAVGDDDADIPF